MNATVPATLRIVSADSQTATVSPYGFEMVCEYEFYPAEKEIRWPTEWAHPGSPATLQLLACKVAGVDIYEMLSLGQIERIEDELMENHE